MEDNIDQDLKLYYTPPPGYIFSEVRDRCIDIWNTYDNTYGYVDEKVNSIKDLENITGNFMYMISKFDIHNLRKLISSLSNESRLEIIRRLSKEMIDYLDYLHL